MRGFQIDTMITLQRSEVTAVTDAMLSTRTRSDIDPPVMFVFEGNKSPLFFWARVYFAEWETKHRRGVKSRRSGLSTADVCELLKTSCCFSGG